MSRILDVHLLPALVEPSAFAGGIAVMIDVLRASTTMIHALDAGARAVIPCQEVDEARLDVRIERGYFHFRKYGTRSLIETECVRTVITDTGCGIAEEHLHDLFTPFFTTKAEGSGLGLSIARSILEQAGGSLSLNSPASGFMDGFEAMMILPRSDSRQTIHDAETGADLKVKA